MTNTDIVRTVFTAYMAQDAAAARPLYAEDFRFTSPQDDGIDKSAFFDRCFPTAQRLRSQDILELASVGLEGVFLLYEYELLDGGTHRNSEFPTVRDGVIVQTQVFFGGRVPTRPGADPS